jgi:hypothetical protein
MDERAMEFVCLCTLIYFHSVTLWKCRIGFQEPRSSLFFDEPSGVNNAPVNFKYFMA